MAAFAHRPEEAFVNLLCLTLGEGSVTALGLRHWVLDMAVPVLTMHPLGTPSALYEFTQLPQLPTKRDSEVQQF